MPSVLTTEKVKEFLQVGNDTALHILSLVKDATGVFLPLQLAAGRALYVAGRVKVGNEAQAPINLSSD